MKSNPQVISTTECKFWAAYAVCNIIGDEEEDKK